MGFAVRNVTHTPSNWRAPEDLPSYLAKHGIVGISGIDTRKLVRHVRTEGAQMGVISTEDVSIPMRWSSGPSRPRGWRARISPRGLLHRALRIHRGQR